MKRFTLMMKKEGETRFTPVTNGEYDSLVDAMLDMTALIEGNEDVKFKIIDGCDMKACVEYKPLLHRK